MTFESDAKITEESFVSSSKRLETSKYEIEEINNMVTRKEQVDDAQDERKGQEEQVEIRII